MADLKNDIVVGMAEDDIEEVLSARALEWNRREDNLDWDSDHDPTVGPLVARYYAIEREAGASLLQDRDIVIKVDVGPDRKAVRVLVQPEYTGL